MQASSVFDSIAEAANELISFRSTDHTVTDDELKRKSIEIAKRGYSFDAVSVEALKAYLQGYSLLLSGDVGTGKTMFFSVIKSKDCGSIVKLSMLEMSAYKLDTIVEMVDDHNNRELLIDDIGNEPIYNNYGCKMDLLPWIIERRMKSNKRTHYTTNLDGEKLVARYGDRVVDRLHEMCKAFSFKGKSKRFTKVNAEYVRESNRKYDWTLCAERCANCSGVSCMMLVKVPPDQQEHSHIPEQCNHFRKLEMSSAMEDTHA